MADFVSPFACSHVQQQESTPPVDAALGSRLHHESSRSGSPVRVVGFNSSPTSVVALRRWQSAADAGAAAAIDAAAAGGSGNKHPVTAPPLRQCSLGRQSSLGALLKQQGQQHQLQQLQQKRLSINTSRSPTGRRRQSPPAQRQQQACIPPPAAAAPHHHHAPAPAVAAIAEDLEQDWMAALTPDSAELQEAAAAPLTTAAPCGGLANGGGSHAGPAPAEAAAAADVGGGADFTLPAHAGCGLLQRPHAPAPGAARAMLRQHSALPAAAAAGGLTRQGGGSLRPPPAAAPAAACGNMVRQGSACIAIPYHLMKRAETAPALTDDIIAAAVAAVNISTSAASSKALSAAGGSGGAGGGRGSGSGPPSSGNSSYKGSPPTMGGGRDSQLQRQLRPVPERQVSAVKELFDAQAEAVVALTQARVLQQALAQEQERVDQLQQQVKYLMRERAEDDAQQQRHQQEWMAQQQQWLQEQLQAQQQWLQAQQAQQQAEWLQAQQQAQWMQAQQQAQEEAGWMDQWSMHGPQAAAAACSPQTAMHYSRYQGPPPPPQQAAAPPPPAAFTLPTTPAVATAATRPLARAHPPRAPAPAAFQAAPARAAAATGLERHQQANLTELAAALAALGH